MDIDDDEWIEDEEDDGHHPNQDHHNHNQSHNIYQDFNLTNINETDINRIVGSIMTAIN